MTLATKSSQASPPLGRRQANIAARRQRILESARTLLAEAGQEGLSMRKLAREAGLSVTTLYNLVGSRDDILRALIDDSAERFESTVDVAEPAGDPLTRTIQAFEHILRYVVDEAAILKPLIVANLATGYTKELGKEEHGLSLRGAKDAVRSGLMDALAEGQIRDVVGPEYLEGQLYMGLELALDRWAYGILDNDEFRTKSLWGAYVALLAVVSHDSRARLERELQELERKWRMARAREGPAERC